MHDCSRLVVPEAELSVLQPTEHARFAAQFVRMAPRSFISGVLLTICMLQVNADVTACRLEDAQQHSVPGSSYNWWR